MNSGFLRSIILKTVLVTAVIQGGVVGLAGAQSSDEEQLFIEGVSAFERGEYTEAVRQFQSAFRTQRQPNLAFNIAVGFERLGDLKSSLIWYRTYRSFNPPDAVSIESKIVQLQTASGLELTTTPASSAKISGFKPAAVGLGVIGVVTASVLGGMAMYYSGRSEETSNRERQGIYARDAESYALATDLTLVITLASLAYGGTLLLDEPPVSANDL